MRLVRTIRRETGEKLKELVEDICATFEELMVAKPSEPWVQMRKIRGRYTTSANARVFMNIHIRVRERDRYLYIEAFDGRDIVSAHKIDAYDIEDLQSARTAGSNPSVLYVNDLLVILSNVRSILKTMQTKVH